MLNVLYVIIMDKLQSIVEVDCFKLIIASQKDHQLTGTLRDIVLLAIYLVTKTLIAIEGI